jgi:hypothetical protein
VEGPYGFAGVVGAHQAFPDEDAVGPGFENAAGVFGVPKGVSEERGPLLPFSGMTNSAGGLWSGREF